MAEGTGGFGGVGSSTGMGEDQRTADDSKALTEAVRQMAAAYRESSGALEHYGRLSAKARKEHEKFRDVLLEDAKAAKDWGKQLFSLRGQYDDAKQSVKGFAGEMMRLGSISKVYADKLMYMRKGQEAFTKSLVATTGDTARAMEKSQQYVNAVHHSYANASKVAGEFRVETATLKKAVDDLNARFATQIAASGDMSGAMKGMQRDALVLGRYLGVEMSEIMDVWNDRMQQTTMTLDQSRKELIAVTYTADKYAKELAKMGDQFLKTGNVGKNEFLKMVQDVGKELRTGAYDAAAYSAALKDLLVKGKEGGLSVNEQRESAEAMKKVLSESSTMGGKLAVFGIKAAEQMISQWDDLSNFKNEHERKRMEIVRETFKDAPEPQKMEAVMSAMKGSASFNARIMHGMKDSTTGELNLELVKTVTQSGGFISSVLTKQIKNGEAALAFEKEAEAGASGEREEQTQLWRKGFEDMVKAGATPKDLDYKMVALVDEGVKYLEFLATKFPYMLMGGQLLGSLGGTIIKRIAGGLATSAATKALTTGGGGLINVAGAQVAPHAVRQSLMSGLTLGPSSPLAAGGGLGSKALALGSRALPMIGKGGILGATFAASYYGSKALDAAAVKLVEDSGDALKGTFESYTDYLTSSIAHGKETAAIMDKMTWEEKDKRKKVIKSLEKEIEHLENLSDVLSEEQKQRLRIMKRERDKREQALGGRMDRQRAAEGEAGFESQQHIHKTLLKRMQIMAQQGITAANPEEYAKQLMTGNLGEGAPQLREHLIRSGDQVPQAIARLMESMSPEDRAKIGAGTDDVFKAASEQAMRYTVKRSEYGYDAKGKAKVEGMSKERIAELYYRLHGEKLGEGDRSRMSFDDSDKLRTSKFLEERSPVEEARRLLIGAATSDLESQSVSGSLAEPNAKGEVTLTLPVKLKMNLSKMNDGLAKQRSKDDHGR
jgi:hypothetical protein